jgi:hypothetical protein
MNRLWEHKKEVEMGHLVKNKDIISQGIIFMYKISVGMTCTKATIIHWMEMIMMGGDERLILIYFFCIVRYCFWG